MNPPLRSPDAIFRSTAWRLIPFLALLYIFNILNRVSVGFAAIDMVPDPDLGMSKEQFDFGIGIFYVGYLLFQIPANLLLGRIGARRWIAWTTAGWGVVSCATLAAAGPSSFYLIRVLLGVAQAGFFPGIILYLTYWFPARERAKMMALFMTAISFSGVIGYPLHGAIMYSLNGMGGWKGWQWLFLLEGLPAVLLGFLGLLVLPDGPRQASWLSPGERDWTLGQVQETPAGQPSQARDLLRAVIDWRVWVLIGIYFTVALGSNGAGAYMPRLVKEQFKDSDTLVIGFLTALPPLCAILGAPLIAISSDRTGERCGHLAFSAFLGAGGWLLCANSTGWLFLAGFCLAQVGMMGMLPTFWTLPPMFLKGAVAVAGGIGLINSVANLGGFVAPILIGKYGPLSVALVLFAGGLLALCVRPPRAAPRPAGEVEPSVGPATEVTS